MTLGVSGLKPAHLGRRQLAPISPRLPDQSRWPLGMQWNRRETQSSGFNEFQPRLSNWPGDFGTRENGGPEEHGSYHWYFPAIQIQQCPVERLHSRLVAPS